MALGWLVRLLHLSALLAGLVQGEGPAKPVRLSLRTAGPRLPKKHGCLSADKPKVEGRFGSHGSIDLAASLMELYQLTVDAYVGTPPQLVPIVLDTSIPYSFLPSPNCTAPSCTGLAQNAFDRLASSSYVGMGTMSSKQLGDYVVTMDGVTGEVSTDLVSIGGATFTGAFLYVNSTLTPTPKMLMYNGRLGIGYPYYNTNTMPSFLPGLFNGLPKIFSISMGNYTDYDVIGTAEFGGYDSSLINSSTWVTMPNSGSALGYWAIYVQNVKIGALSLGFNGPAIVDLASPFITVPYSTMNTIATILQLSKWGTKMASSQAQASYWKIPCANAASMSSLTLTIAGINYVIPPQLYLIGDGINCITTLYGHDLGNPVGSTWIAGNSLLRGMLTVFNYDSNTISWGRLLTA